MPRLDHDPIPFPAADEPPIPWLAPAKNAVDDNANLDQRFENWIACQLEDHGPASPQNAWITWLGPRAAANRSPEPRPRRESASAAGWPRFRMRRHRGVTILKLVDRDLIKHADIRELRDDLLSLIQSGYVRIVLDFSTVEHLTSGILGVVVEAHRRCEALGGRLKLCGLEPRLAEVFTIARVARELRLEPDPSTAVDGPWPAEPTPRPLPVELLSALTDASRDVEPDGPPPEVPFMSDACLIVETGRARGRSIPIQGSRFVIGRDRVCHLRPSSPSVSRFHASIERNAERLWLRDLGSTNGTFLNGRPVEGEDVPLHDGDQIEIGPMRFTLALGVMTDPSSTPALLIDGLQTDEGPSSIDHPTVREIAAISSEAEPRGLRQEMIEDVVVLTPLLPALDDEATLGPLRLALQALLEQGPGQRIVLNLEHVGQLSSPAIALIVAFHLKLDKSGSSLRVGNPTPRVLAVLEQVKLPQLIACHPTLEDAILEPWPRRAG
jgi:anti-anti-sigma factor